MIKTNKQIILDEYKGVFNKRYPSNKCIICLERSLDLVATIYHLYQRSICFIIIDPYMNQQQFNYIINDNPDAFVITNKKHRDLFESSTVLLIEEMKNCKIDRHIESKKSNVAYIMYTSGSTGLPKGVKISKNAFVNFVEGIPEVIRMKPVDIISCFTNVTFDIFLLESLAALIWNLQIIVADEEEQKNPKQIARILVQNNVSIVQMTPSRLLLLLNYDKSLECLSKVKTILVGGEIFPQNLLRLLKELTSAKIYNMYGPTETTIWSTVSDLTDKTAVDIGNPIRNTRIYIVDPEMKLVKDEDIGEICIAGSGLADGYSDSALTEYSFVILAETGERVYRTGDLGKFNAEGVLEYIGRLDNQVKIRGYRVELEQIEKTLVEYENISQAIVVPVTLPSKNEELVAFYTCTKPVNELDIFQYVSNELHSYMLPSKYIRLDNFPYTPNGKVDRVKLKSYDNYRVKKEQKNLSEKHQQILNIIMANAGITECLIEVSLELAGIDSIAFIKIAVALEDEYDFEFDDEMLVSSQFKNVMELINYVETCIK